MEELTYVDCNKRWKQVISKNITNIKLQLKIRIHKIMYCICVCIYRMYKSKIHNMYNIMCI